MEKINDHELMLNIRAWGCKIKTEAFAELILENRTFAQGEDLNLKIHFDFDSNDVPNKLEVALEQHSHTQPPALSLKIPSIIEVKEPSFDLDLPLKYISGEPGNYRLDVNFRHAEYGTELVMVQPITFKLIAPKVDLLYCKSSIPKVSKGQEVQIAVGLNFPAPQKLRGLIFGRLVAVDKVVNRIYELEPKRISFIGDKEIYWSIMVPQNETGTGRFKAIIEFKSKDTISKREFDDVFEIRQDQSLRLNSLTSSKELVSGNDEVVIHTEFENVGLKDLELKIKTEIIVDDSNQGKSKKWPLNTIDLSLNADEKREIEFTWQIPDDAPNGKYYCNFNWKYGNTGVLGESSKELFEVRKHHELFIADAIISNEPFRPGAQGEIKILISDTGTRAGSDLEILCRILDIFNQEVFAVSKKIEFKKGKFEYTLVWPVKEDLEAGKYDLTVSIGSNGSELVKRKFSKFLIIEHPVKFELHLILPGIPETGQNLPPGLGKYLIENEKMNKKIVHNDLEIYKLNTNTHIFSINNEPITYGDHKKTSKEILKQFINSYFEYILTLEYINPKTIENELDYWSKIGYCWTNLILSDKNIRKGPGISEVKISGNQKLRLTAWGPIAKAIFKYASGKLQDNKLKLNAIYTDNIANNKNIKNTPDFSLTSAALQFIFKEGLRFKKLSKDFDNGLKGDMKQNLDAIAKLSSTLRSSGKFKTVPNSAALEKNFNKILSTLLNRIKHERIDRKPDQIKFEMLSSGYYYVLLYLATEITYKIQRLKKERSASLNEFWNIVLYKILYFFLLIQYYKCQAKFNKNLSKTDLTNLSEHINSCISEIRKNVEGYWQIHKRWQSRYINYVKNMKKRERQVFIHDHVKITTNPIIIEGMRGGTGGGKIILGNDGSHPVKLEGIFALPSTHWSLIEPEAQLINNLYYVKKMKIPSKQTKELKFTISMPNSLTFGDYKGVLKLNNKPFELLNEII
jgi:hypothetical protein